MRISLSRRSVLTALVLTILLIAIPGAIRRIIQTGDPYLFTRNFFEDMVMRLRGPGRLRFILQPTAALLLGVRDGIKDARNGSLPYLRALLSAGASRTHLLRSAFESVRDLISIAVLLDVIAQFLIFRRVHPGAALLLGPVLITVPYTLFRSLANPMARRRGLRAPVLPPD